MPLSKIDSDSLNSGAVTSTALGSGSVTSAALGSALTFTGQQTIPTINLTGGQITFPAIASISSNANTLDDYEEGTWSPTFVNWTATTGWSFVNSRYVKIGQLVYIAAELSPGSVTLSCPANQAFLSNLPFSVSYPNSPVAWSTNYIDTLGTGVIYAGPSIYAPALSVANIKSVYVTGVYTTAQ